MTQKIRVKTKVDKVTVSPKTLEAILEKLRLLRNEIMLLLPQEDLKDYAHPGRIQHSYQQAIKKYPLLII